MMINEALLADKNELNNFTAKLSIKCQTKGSAWVKLRDGSIVEIEYHGTNDPDENDYFGNRNYSHCWHLDGSSYKNFMYDIIASGSLNLLHKTEV
jgi:hypothetical protein